ncbi:GTPase Era [Aliikangiella marina]|uniref:GTPase Era n=1 Tax=Aliikangiella marina TaxID=1712262 RepID=A0A545TDT0_9GAMM|nr:GTPase Era [Aliikangiella marina]TQV75377.1 GTPase Era [Aliikangiella marina]
MAESNMHCGFVAFVGRPNVGKSTLLNQLLGHKLSITSRKPQTTRHRIMGIDTIDATQMIYVDTPGLHKKEPKAINRLMNRAASSSISDVDIVVFVVEPGKWTEDDQLVLDHIKSTNRPVVLFLNKVDQIKDKEALLPILKSLAERHNFKEIIPGSALKGQQVEALKSYLLAAMPEGDFVFPEDYYTDRSERFLAAEIIREKLIRQLGDELPYSITVEIEQFKADENGLLKINGLILVERKGQKSIVIGKGGQRLKQVGTDARKDMKRLFGQKVFLELWVKVKDGWADDERALRSLGFDDFKE